MSQSDQPNTSHRRQYTFNMTLAAVAGQVGCLTLVIIFLTLFGGLWLDNQFDTKPLFTIFLLVGSVPVTIILMFLVVRKATSKMKTSLTENSETQQEEADRAR